MPLIQDPKALKEAVKRLYEAHVNTAKEDTVPDAGPSGEAERQGGPCDAGACPVLLHWSLPPQGLSRVQAAAAAGDGAEGHGSKAGG